MPYMPSKLDLPDRALLFCACRVELSSVMTSFRTVERPTEMREKSEVKYIYLYPQRANEKVNDSNGPSSLSLAFSGHLLPPKFQALLMLDGFSPASLPLEPAAKAKVTTSVVHKQVKKSTLSMM